MFLSRSPKSIQEQFRYLDNRLKDAGTQETLHESSAEIHATLSPVFAVIDRRDEKRGKTNRAGWPLGIEQTPANRYSARRRPLRHCEIALMKFFVPDSPAAG